jgi:hypothetical protein
MAKTAPKNATPTQKFIEIVDIVDDIVILAGKNACLIIEVMATNFALLSAEEQEAKIYSYASLLNSLSFPIQIVIRSKKLDVSSYLKLLDEERAKAQTESLSKQMGLYRDFVQELVKVNTILDKKFYIVIPYSTFENAPAEARGTATGSSSQKDFISEAKAGLYSKADAIHSQLNRLNLKSERLGKEKLTKLFYDIFNDVHIDNQQTDHLADPLTLGRESAHARN